jgi:hypothetical protein
MTDALKRTDNALFRVAHNHGHAQAAFPMHFRDRHGALLGKPDKRDKTGKSVTMTRIWEKSGLMAQAPRQRPGVNSRVTLRLSTQALRVIVGIEPHVFSCQISGINANSSASLAKL